MALVDVRDSFLIGWLILFYPYRYVCVHYSILKYYMPCISSKSFKILNFVLQWVSWWKFLRFGVALLKVLKKLHCTKQLSGKQWKSAEIMIIIKGFKLCSTGYKHGYDTYNKLTILLFLYSLIMQIKIICSSIPPCCTLPAHNCHLLHPIPLSPDCVWIGTQVCKDSVCLGILDYTKLQSWYFKGLRQQSVCALVRSYQIACAGYHFTNSNTFRYVH